MRAMRVDANQRDIIAAFAKMGASVEVIRSPKPGCPDLLVGFQGKNYLVEVKVPKTGRLSDAQKLWRDNWKGSKPFVMTGIDDVLAFVGLVGGLR
jgi:hypothetical protein